MLTKSASATGWKPIDIATLDERHFRALKPLSGGQSFRLLPADSS